MHFYQKNIGDFNNATRHLTRVERSLFSDAIELYYDTEKHLTSDINKLNRLLLAHSQEEKDALLAVLGEFFTLTDEGYFNKRCNEEILKYQAYMESKSKAGKASAEQRAKQKSTGVQQVFNTTSTKQNQEPITNNPLPITNNQIKNISPLSSLMALGISKKSAQDWLKVRKSKKLVLTDDAIDLFKAECAKAKLTPAEAVKICNQESWGGFKSDWLNKDSGGNVTQFKSAGQQRIENTNKAVDEFLGEGNQSNIIEGEYQHA